jgi:signal transduction histidine kinase
LTRLYFKEKRDRCSLIYTDNGVGIVNEEKKKIFEEGYGEGTGQGLYLIKEISTMYGWEVMEAGTYGKGAKFVILIPKYNEEGIENYKIE